jgi:hypothetical protein
MRSGPSGGRHGQRDICRRVLASGFVAYAAALRAGYINAGVLRPVTWMRLHTWRNLPF